VPKKDAVTSESCVQERLKFFKQIFEKILSHFKWMSLQVGKSIKKKATANSMESVKSHVRIVRGGRFRNFHRGGIF